MPSAETLELTQRLNTARTEHRDLDMAIEALAAQAVPDQLLLVRMKRRKLRLRDEISRIEGQLIPDLIA